MENFVNNILDNIVSSVLVFGGAALIGYLWKKRPTIAGPVVAGLIALATLSIAWYGITGRPVFAKYQTMTTEDNIESQIKAWVEEFGMGYAKVTPTPADAYFLLDLTATSGRHIGVGRFKSNRWLQFRSEMDMSSSVLARIKALSQPQAERYSDEVFLDLNRAGVGFMTFGAPINHVTLMKAVPVTPALTEDAFFSTIDQMDSAGGVATYSVLMSIGDAERFLPASDKSDHK